MTLPQVTVLIPVKNVVDYIDDAIQSMLELDYPKDKLEIIVLDAFSTDGTVDKLSKYPVKVVQEDCNPPTAYNHVMHAVKGDIVAFGDGDAVVDKNWLKEIVKHLDNPGVAGAGGISIAKNFDKLIPKLIDYEKQSRVYDKMPRYVHRLPTMTVAYKKDVLLEVGGFDESLNTGYDADIGHKIVDAGYKIIHEPKAKVYHYNRPNLVKYFKQQYNLAKGAAKLYQKSPHMVKGDEVTPFRMNIQPPLYALALLLLFAAIIISDVFYLFTLALIFFLILWYVLSAAKLSIRHRDLAAMLLVVLYITRGVAWTVGGMGAVIDIVCRRRR